MTKGEAFLVGIVIGFGLCMTLLVMLGVFV
jgi:hypothetical protein